jgi:hypothetical protein
LDLFRAKFRWLLLEDSKLPNTEEVLQGLDLLLDSDVVVGRRISETSFRLLEVYKRGPREGLIWGVTGIWQADTAGVRPTSSRILSVRRTNIQKSVLKAVMVVRPFRYYRVFKKVKPTPCRFQGGEEIELLLILDLGIRWE